MNLLNAHDYPLWLNVVIFMIGAIVVWKAGTRLAHLTDTIAERTGLGHVFLGMLLLGGITSLPELATTVSASLVGNAPLAVNNVLGGVAMQVAILGVADAAVRRHALTRVVDEPVIILEGVLLIAGLALVGVAIITGDFAVAGIGIWSTAIFVLVIAGLYLIKRTEGKPSWKPTHPFDEEMDERDERDREEPARQMSTPRLTLWTIGAGFAILVAGFAVARTGDALAEQTNLGSSFVGAVAVAIATSLPELSTTLAAMRIGRYRLAFSNIFGTNLFDVGILFFADLTYRDAAVLNEVGAFSQAAVLLGIVLTLIYIAGIIERSDRTIFGIGYDSVLALLTYAGGVFLLYTLR